MKKDNYFIFGVWFGIKRVGVKKVWATGIIVRKNEEAKGEEKACMNTSSNLGVKAGTFSENKRPYFMTIKKFLVELLASLHAGGGERRRTRVTPISLCHPALPFLITPTHTHWIINPPFTILH